MVLMAATSQEGYYNKDHRKHLLSPCFRFIASVHGTPESMGRVVPLRGNGIPVVSSGKGYGRILPRPTAYNLVFFSKGLPLQGAAGIGLVPRRCPLHHTP